MSEASLYTELPAITTPPQKRSKLVRKSVFKKKSSAHVVTASSLQKIHDESERRLSNLTDNDYEKFRRATVRINKTEEESLNGLVLETVRQNSVNAKKVDVVSATRSIASQFEAVCDSDLVTESLNAIINQLGQGNVYFENGDLFEYVRQVFKKSKFETDKLINTLKERNESAHTLQILLERANLKRAPKSSAFCSMTLKKTYEPMHFSLCSDNNTVLSTLCGSQSPLWDATLSLPLETTKGYSLVVAIWETRANATLAVVNEGKKCLGFVEIDLNSQPTTGSRQWWELSSVKKPNSKKPRGKVHVGLRYNAEVGRHVNAVMVHAGMLSKFLSVDYPKSGTLSGIAAHILELQKIQQKLSIDEFRYVDWLVRVELYVKTNNLYEMLHRVLNLLLDCVNKSSCQLSHDHLSHLWKSFTDFQTKYIERMMNLNVEYPYTSESAVINVKYFTKCYLSIVECPKYAERHAPVLKQSSLELDNALKGNSSRWIDSMTKPFQGKADDSLTEMVTKLKDMANAVRLELRNESTTYGPALEGTPYKGILLYQINEKISNVSVSVLSSVIAHLKSRPYSEEDTPDEDLLNDCLGLYVAVSDLKKLCNDMAPGYDHALNNFHSWFYSVIETWLHMVQVKHRIRVAKCVDYDHLDRLDMHVPYSSCVVDMETMNHFLCHDIREVFDFPDESSRYSVISKLNKQVLESAVQLTELLLQKGKAVLDRGTKKFGENKLTPDDLIKKSLVVICSLEENRNHLETLPELVGWNELSANSGLVEKLKQKRDEAGEIIHDYKLRWMTTMCESLIEPKFIEAFKKFINLAYNRDDSAAETLVLMLEEELSLINANVESQLFEEMLRVIWERIVLPQFERHVAVRPAKIKNYYDILQDSFKELSDFFVTEMPKTCRVITENTKHKKLLYILQNLTIPLEDLLFRYYLEERIQQSKQYTSLGFITFTAFLSQQNDKTILKVTVIRCSGLPMMDTLGKCDAIVKVTLQPRLTSHFSHLKIKQTKPIFNDLDPVFNQDFDMSFYSNLDTLDDGACLHFTIWDKDKFSADDFIGEVLCDINSIPFDSPREFRQHIALPDLNCLSYDVIKHRGPYEKTAEKFVKERSTLVNEAGEDFIQKRGSALTIFSELTKKLRLNSLTE